MMALESVHIDPLDTRPHPPPDAGYLDLENAVLMQELMALKVIYPAFTRLKKCWLNVGTVWYFILALGNTRH